MRLCKLKLRNFISHVNTEIDFENIINTHNTNFILISGNTGSGKSAILDGLIAGLYGTGRHNTLIGNRQALSDYADNGKWEVEVEFIINDKRYKVIRKGSTARWFVQENGTFKRLTTEPPLPIKEGKIARQVMIIPQGQYLKLLTATKSERKDLLLDLINLDWLDRFIQKMKDLRNRLEQQVKDKSQDLKSSLKDTINNAREIEKLNKQGKFDDTLEKFNKWLEEIEEINPEEDPDRLRHFVESEKVLDTLNSLLNDLSEEKKEIESIITQKESEKTKLDRLKTRMEELNTPLEKARRTLENLKELESQKKHISQLETKLAELRQLETLFKDLIDNLDKTRKEIGDLTKQIYNLGKDIKALEEAEESLRTLHKIAKDNYENIDTEISKLINDLWHLSNTLSTGKSYYDKWRQAEALRQTLEQLLQEVEQVQKFANLSGKLKPYINIIDNLKQDINKAQKDKEAKEKERDEVDRQLSELKKELEKIESQIKQLQKQKEEKTNILEDLKTKRQQLEEERQRIEEDYRQIIIAELVSQLKDGEPCPICGSTEHPHPASAGNFSAEDLQKILKERNEIKSKIEDIDKQIQQLEETLKNIENKLNDLSEREKQKQERIKEQENKLTAINTEINAKEEEISQKTKQLNENRQSLKNEINNSGIYERYETKNINITEEDYARWVINQLQRDWQTLLKKVAQIGISAQKTQLSGSTAGNLKTELQNKLNDIEKLKNQYESWKQGTYDGLAKQISDELEVINSKLEVFINDLMGSGVNNENLRELTQLLHTLRKDIDAIENMAYFKEQVYVDFEEINELDELRDKLATDNADLKRAIGMIDEQLENLKNMLSEQRGKLKQLEQTKEEKEKERAELMQQIEDKRKDNNISLSIEEIKEKLTQLDRQNEWQREITSWKTERKTIFENLSNDLSQLYEKLQDEKLKEVLKQDELPKLPDLSQSSDDLQNTSFDLNAVLTRVEQWLEEASRIVTERIKELGENISHLETEINNLRNVKDKINSLGTSIGQNTSNLRNHLENIEETLRKTAQFLRLFKVVGVEGSRRRDGKPSLENWLSQFILNNMLKNASPYLREFTDGRLDFVVSDSDSQDTIQIVDYSYGKVRNVNDLSGGEKFMTALSLALGLTDLLMQFEQNASRPNFLFIDEGFGTLDAERLEKVVAQLKNYADKHDILLGVISHRQEMHALAPVRIHVTHDRTKKGSRIKIIAN
ncbi:MAG: AAA family ATPase [Chlorobi bacterium]|nr:AAA family ATPase [Chlorobiota bacterium]